MLNLKSETCEKGQFTHQRMKYLMYCPQAQKKTHLEIARKKAVPVVMIAELQKQSHFALNLKSKLSM